MCLLLRILELTPNCHPPPDHHLQGHRDGPPPQPAAAEGGGADAVLLQQAGCVGAGGYWGWVGGVIMVGWVGWILHASDDLMRFTHIINTPPPHHQASPSWARSRRLASWRAATSSRWGETSPWLASGSGGGLQRGGRWVRSVGWLVGCMRLYMWRLPTNRPHHQSLNRPTDQTPTPARQQL
jgi:hypothetical protein